MPATETNPNKVHYPYFNLSPVKLVEALKSAMPMDKLTTRQQLFAEALLLQNATQVVFALAHKSSQDATTTARKLPPAWSMTRVGPYEEQLYKLMDQTADAQLNAEERNHKVEEFSHIICPQTITITAHPNFARSRKLVEDCNKLNVRLIDSLSRADQHHVQGNGVFDKDDLIVKSLLADITGQIAASANQPPLNSEAASSPEHRAERLPRVKRTRAEEQHETVTDMIPTVMESATKQIEAIKQRRMQLGRAQISDYKESNKQTRTEKRKRPNSANQWRQRNVTVTSNEVSGNAEPIPFKSVSQLDCMAAMLPRFNSWSIADGDGKRTSHIYDTEMAIPTIKRATYQHYLKNMELLKNVPIQGLDVAAVTHALQTRIKLLTQVEELATERMDALNALHQLGEHPDPEEKLATQKRAEKACYIYMKKLDDTPNGLQLVGQDENVGAATIKDLLREDYASELKTQIKDTLENVYKGGRIEKPHKEILEDTYMKLATYGNFSVRLQRRENAEQYRDVLAYLVNNNELFTKELSKNMPAPEGRRYTEKDLQDIVNNHTGHPEEYSKMVAFFAESVMKKNQLAKTVALTVAGVNTCSNSGAMLPQNAGRVAYNKGSFKWLAQLLGQRGRDNPNEANYEITPLQPRALLALDDLGYFNMAKLYPEAFAGGFVIAEFGQPDLEILQTNDPDKIKEAVKRTATDDMMLQVAFAKCMGAEKSPLIPLHEDPETMRHIPDAQNALRSRAIKDYLLQYMGIDGEQKGTVAKQKALKYLKEDGSVDSLNAYQYMQRFGLDEAEMIEQGLNPSQLKHTYVLEGPKDMEACSDNSKRASHIGLKLAEQSVRAKQIQAAKQPIKLGQDNYIIVKPKYYGQGGAVGRATDIPLDSVEATWQGDHPLTFNPESLAQKSTQMILGRLYMAQEAAFGKTLSDRLAESAANLLHNTGNMLGLPGCALSEGQKNLMDVTMQARFDATRDDQERYNAVLDKYGADPLNHSARPDAKGAGGSAKKANFVKDRAIGNLWKESDTLTANIVNLAAMFDVSSKGEHKGKITSESIREIREWKAKDASIQHILTTAALMANYVNPEFSWSKGGIAYQKHEDGSQTLTKDTATVSLDALVEAYDAKEQSLTKDGVTFDAADLVMAHLTRQYTTLKEGLLRVYEKPSLLALFAPAQRETITYTDNLNQRIKTELANPSDGKVGDDEHKLLQGAYTLLFESGPQSQFPVVATMEQGLSSHASQETPFATHGVA